MANVFKNAKLSLSESIQDIYTVPTSTTAIIFNAHVANVAKTSPAASANYPLTLSWVDVSSSSAVTYLADEIVIPKYSAYQPIQKLILEAGDILQGFSSASAALDVTLSILEQS